MVWGAIGMNYRTGLIKCSQGENSEEYLKIIQKSRLIETCNELFGEKCWMFMHDGAPCHNASSTIK